jgi:hypothetical protein
MKISFHSNSVERLIAALILGVISIISFINIYVSSAVPVWDGDIYNKLNEGFVRGHYSFGDVEIKKIFPIHILNFQLGATHKLTGIEIIYIYPALN